MSCGVIELSSIQKDYEGVLFALASSLYHPSRGQPAAFVVWSDTDLELFNFINLIKKFPKQATSQGPVENPKTGNGIYVFTWEIPHEEFKQWYKDQRIARIKKQ